MSKRIYLAGPIHAVEDNGRTWRQTVEEMCDEVTWLNPLDQYNHETDDTLADAAIRALDRELIDTADAMLLRYELTPSWGTPREMEYVSEYGTGPDIPVVVWTKVSPQEWSAWVTDAAVIQDSLEVAVESVVEIV